MRNDRLFIAFWALLILANVIDIPIIQIGYDALAISAFIADIYLNKR